MNRQGQNPRQATTTGGHVARRAAGIHPGERLAYGISVLLSEFHKYGNQDLTRKFTCRRAGDIQ
jgi:hypothetical protein